MMYSFVTSVTHIYLACGATDGRKQIDGLSSLVNMKFHLDPYQHDCVFLFCNKRKTTLKILRYDKNGFVLASKRLLDGMKFQWPAREEEVKQLTLKQVQWLLDGLSIEQKKAHHDVKINGKNSCF